VASLLSSKVQPPYCEVLSALALLGNPPSAGPPWQALRGFWTAFQYAIPLLCRKDANDDEPYEKYRAAVAKLVVDESAQLMVPPLFV
jgi:hypothetical protein